MLRTSALLVRTASCAMSNQIPERASVEEPICAFLYIAFFIDAKDIGPGASLTQHQRDERRHRSFGQHLSGNWGGPTSTPGKERDAVSDTSLICSLDQ